MSAARSQTRLRCSDLKFPAHFFSDNFLEMFSSSPQSSLRASNTLQYVGIEGIRLHTMFC